VTRKDQIIAGAAALAEDGQNYEFGKPDTRDLVWMVSKAAGRGEPDIDNTAPWLDAMDAYAQLGVSDAAFAAVALGFLDAEFGLIEDDRPMTPRQASWLGAAHRAAAEGDSFGAGLFGLLAQPNEAERG
jgi:hypothetical protein